MNTSLTIAVGTESKQKLGYVTDVLAELGVEADVVPFKAESGVSEQPLTSEETLQGATNRAQEALRNVSTANFGLGIEVGYDRSDGGYEIFCWAVMVGGDGSISKAKSHSFRLPLFYNKVLEDGRYVGDHVRDYFAVAPDPITQYVAEVVRGRRLFITESLRYVFIYALHREFYGEVGD